MNPNLLQTILGVVIIIVQNFHGLFLPYFIDLLNQYVASSKARQIISIMICAAVASILNINEILAISDWSDAALIVGKITFIWTQAQLVYKQFYENSDLRISTYGKDIAK